MFHRPHLPPPGTPISSTGPNSLRGVAQELAAAAMAARVVDFQGPIAALAGPGGLQINAADFPRLAVFQVTDRWHTHPADGNVPQQCAYTTARPVYYFAASGIWQAAVDAVETTIWHPCGYQLDSADPARTAPAAAQSRRQFMPSIGIGQWCWCCFDQAAAAWQVLDGFEDIVRVKLTTDWPACGSASGTLLIASADADLSQGFDTGVTLQLYDPLGIINTDFAAVQAADSSSSGTSSGTSGGLHIPAGTCAVVKRFADSNAWEPLRFGAGPCGSSSSSSSSGSSSSGSSGSSSSGTPCHPVGIWANVPGYDPTKKQVLGHDHGCLQWFDVGTC